MSDRLPMLRTRPQYGHLSDELCLQILREAALDFEAYTNRSDPGAEADSVILELACIKLNMLGAEGTTSASEGDISRAWDTIPESLKLRMDRWRRPLWPRRST